ncbi:PaaI family thioesterase [Nioella sp. MMSF_3534]|uniref:PaaI family thioesterase n=1 Tax=Nioella sp. MMSF_3534 TaxID=3046720 RepID=UPI00273F368D|nr:PaaI family thioesterase [Nioella sp. MMSF_3534]
MGLAMDKSALSAFLQTEFAQVADDFTIEEVQEMGILVRLKVDERHLRPGGTVSGPSMFALADVSIYLAVLAMVGPKALAVTTNISMDFMRKPAAAADLLCDCRLLKLGKTLAVGDCLIRSEGMEAPVARASMTYAIPPDR